MAGIVDKAEEIVSDKAPHVFGALRQIRFLLIGIPLLSIILGLLVQTVMPERDIVTAVFKVGSIATPGNPAHVAPLASNSQMKARLRTGSFELDEKYPGSLLLTIDIDNDVVAVTATALGIQVSKDFLAAVIDREISFQNGRLDKMRAVQAERRTLLEAQRAELEKRVKELDRQSQGISTTGDAASWVRLQQLRAHALDRIDRINLQLNASRLTGVSDLFIDKSAVIQEPLLIARSQWYRPFLYGAIGLAIGLLLTFILAITMIFRAVSKKSRSS